MASYTLIDIGRQYLLDLAGFMRAHPHAWIVWVPPQNAAEHSTVTTVARVAGSLDPASSTPVAMEVVKGVKPNVFPFGITVGRTDNNDLVVRHEEVSRFHAYFQEQDGVRCLIDADSKNGTFVDGKRLTPLKPFALPPEGTLRFGQLEVRYLDPTRFMAYLEKQSK